MQELYVIRILASYKPWRYSRTVYTTSKKLFDFINSPESQETGMVEDLEWASSYLARDLTEDELEDFDYYAYLDDGSVKPEYPFVVLAETEIYTA